MPESLSIASHLELWLITLLAGVAENSVERTAWKLSLERCDCNQWKESKKQGEIVSVPTGKETKGDENLARSSFVYHKTCPDS